MTVWPQIKNSQDTKPGSLCATIKYHEQIIQSTEGNNINNDRASNHKLRQRQAILEASGIYTRLVKLYEKAVRESQCLHFPVWARKERYVGCISVVKVLTLNRRLF